ncbi:Uma2 family endonuclease [Clostridium sp. CX1]|uniref:Uma2 family endonuclease n=1 Tax=Clostridium sp. CX1 TaxID=2978346 RepID=UPI0021BEA5EA|nr:Uma2 family endonuclease [Clostridium sp. CX1]MCT8977871.1 Uma2 family endonuclease [Clostridium sp. CX1]
MSLPKEKLITIDEFYKMKESTDNILEYIDGIVYMSPSPSTKHQRISGRLYAKLFNFLEGKEYEAFSAPYDVQLHRQDIQDDKVVIPDISVICDKDGIEDNKYIGVPTLIMEILSPSNQSNDLVVKLNLYMKYGVKEYWIINPMINTVQIYSLNSDGLYDQIDVVKNSGIINSSIFSGFTVDIEELFK